MDTADSKKQSAAVILHSLSLLGSDAWCYAPIDQDDLTHCSQSFLTMWGFDVPVPGETGGAISLHDPRIGDRLEDMGFGRYWLRDAVKSPGGYYNGFPADSCVCEVQRVVVPDHDGRPVGVLLIFRSTYRRSVSRDVFSKAVESQRLVSKLSPRESEIMGLVFDGFTNKAIAAKAGISEKTVEKHRANIMRKLGTRSIAELIRRVAEVQLIMEDQSDQKNTLA